MSSGFAKAILQGTVNRNEGEVDRRRGGKTIIKSRQICALLAIQGQLKQDRLQRGCCEVNCGTSTTLQGYGITWNRYSYSFYQKKCMLWQLKKLHSISSSNLFVDHLVLITV